MNGARFSVWGQNAPSIGDCKTAPLSQEKIRADNDNSNQIPAGTYLCGLTNEGRTTIFKVVNYGYNLTISFTTY